MTRLISDIIVSDPLYLIIGSILLIIVLIYTANKESKQKEGEYFEDIIPNQILQLVQQTHSNKKLITYPTILIDEDIRHKLMYPLDRNIIEAISTTLYPVTEHSFEYSILHTEWHRPNLTVTVQINIDYCDTVKNLNIHYDHLNMQITCEVKPFKKLRIITIDY